MSTKMGEMVAGDEIDALIVVKLFGGTCARCGKQPATRIESGVVYCSDDCSELIGDFALDDYQQNRLHYSSSIADAWMIVEKLRADGYHFTCNDRGGQPWWAEFANDDYTIGGQASAETEEMAIVEAALAFVADIERIKRVIESGAVDTGETEDAESTLS